MAVFYCPHQNHKLDYWFYKQYFRAFFMRTFTSGGTRFYFMERGEKLPDIHAGRDFTSGYIIWPRSSGKWDVRWKFAADWEEITGQQFDTENAAFLCAHEHHVKRS